MPIDSLVTKVLKQGVRQLEDNELIRCLLQDHEAPVHGQDPDAPPWDLTVGFPDLRTLARANEPELNHCGLSTDRDVAALMAAIELGRRILQPRPDSEAFLCDPEAIWAHYRWSLGLAEVERVFVVGVDARCRWLTECEIARGGVDRCHVEPRQVFSPMLRAGAHRLILVHNHPSGDPTPSTEDERLTTTLVRLGCLLGLPVADHIVVGRCGYFSFAQAGRLR